MCKRKLRVTNEAKEKQHEIDNLLKKWSGILLMERKKRHEIDNISKKQSREYLKEGQNNKKKEMNQWKKSGSFWWKEKTKRNR